MGDMVRGSIILCFFHNIKEVIESVNEEDATSIKFAQKVYRNTGYARFNVQFPLNIVIHREKNWRQ